MADKPLQSLNFPGRNYTYVNTPLSTAPMFDNTVAYSVGDYVFYNRKLYKFISEHVAGSWNSAHVSEITIGNELKNLNTSTNSKYTKPSTGIPASDLASGVIPDVSGKADKVQSATSGNFASLDANGNLTDSGHKHSDYLTEAPVTDVQIDGTSVLDAQGVAEIPIANTASKLGLVYTAGSGLAVQSDGKIVVQRATDEEIKIGTNGNKPVVPTNQHMSTFYGLAKAAGDTTQSASSNAVGTYTDEAKTSIRSMLGAVGTADWAGVDTSGVVMLDNGGNCGIYMTSGHYLRTYQAADSDIKSGTNAYRPITGAKQHQAVFYGLAKAAGDTTQSSSSNAVGTYTDSAKDAIKTMLGIDLASGNIQNVSGTTVTITGEPNARYICGEVATIDITPPATGTIIVRFTSGSTATVLTLPSTVKMPGWFDSTSLEADTIYELSITDGIYGAVMLWAV